MMEGVPNLFMWYSSKESGACWFHRILVCVTSCFHKNAAHTPLYESVSMCVRHLFPAAREASD